MAPMSPFSFPGEGGNLSSFSSSRRRPAWGWRLALGCACDAGHTGPLELAPGFLSEVSGSSVHHELVDSHLGRCEELPGHHEDPRNVTNRVDQSPDPKDSG